MRFGIMAAAAFICAVPASAANWLKYDLSGTATVTGYDVTGTVFTPISPYMQDVSFSLSFDADMYPISAKDYLPINVKTSISDTATGVTSFGSSSYKYGFNSFDFNLTLPGAPDGSFPTFTTGPVSGTLRYTQSGSFASITRRDLTYTADITGFSITSVAPLSEFNYPYFFATVPEPATWAMLIFGFGVIGSVVRCRKATLARAA